MNKLTLLITNIWKDRLKDWEMNIQNLIKDWWLEPSQRKQTRKAKERPKDAQPTRPKKRERASPIHGRKLSHPQPF
jgi:hypothetical protein